MQTKLLVEFSAIFEESPKDLKTYLNGISRSKCLNIMSFFLGFDNQNSQYNDFEELLSMFFCPKNKQYAEDIKLKLITLKNQSRAELIIIHPVICLQIFEFCRDNLSELITQTEEEVEINIFKALLFKNEEYTKLENGIKTDKNISFELNNAILRLTQSFPYSELINYELADVLFPQIIKSFILFQFLETTSETKPLLSKFLTHYNCSDWKIYLAKILSLVMSATSNTREAYTDIKAIEGATFIEDCHFIEKHIISDTASIMDSDFVKIRAHPFYKVKEGIYRTIFRLFILEIIHKGVYFKLNEINSLLDNTVKISNFRSVYCYEFSEKYLLYNILSRIFNNRYLQFKGSEIKGLRDEAEPDYYLKNGSNIFLFESKDILINAKIKHLFDFHKYEEEFKKKLYFEGTNNKIKNEAVLQLIKNVERVLTKQLTFDMDYDEKSICIYPILVLHDRMFNVVGLNFLVNSWFNIELQKLKDKGLCIERVKKITIIDIDTFVLYQDYLKNGIIELEPLIDEYCRFTTFTTKKDYKNENQITEYLLPFSIFVKNYLKDKEILFSPPEILNEINVALFK